MERVPPHSGCRVSGDHGYSFPIEDPPPPGRLVLSKGEYTIAEDKAGRGVFVRGLTEVEVRAFTFILNGDCLSFVIFYL